jgi:hypothetical protein
MSATVKEDGSKVHPDFQPTSETDVALRSTDGLLFYLEKDRLKYYCGDGFPDASDISASFAQKSPDIVDMTDANAKSLYLLLQHMFPRNPPSLSTVSLEIILGAAREAIAIRFVPSLLP